MPKLDLERERMVLQRANGMRDTQERAALLDLLKLQRELDEAIALEHAAIAR